MKSRTLTLLTCFVLVASLFGGSSLTNVALAASQLANTPKDNPAPTFAPAAVNSPGLLTIPYSTATVTVDGSCSQNEYGATGFSFADGTDAAGDSTGTVYLTNDGDFLYVCMVGTSGTFNTRFGALYLDPQGNGSSYTYAQSDDFQLKVNLPDPTGSARSSFHGSGAAAGTLRILQWNSLWSGAATTGKADQVEYKIPLKNFGINACYGIFGLAVYHHWFAAQGNDYGWPSNQWYDQPHTWQLATLGNKGCANGTAGNIAYVYRGNTLDASSFYSMLSTAGYTVDLIPLGDVLNAATNFANYDLIIIADDTGTLNQWGSSGLTAAQVAKIADPVPGKAVKPIIGLGEGGYAFFGQLSMFIGWPHGWHGPQNAINRNSPASDPYFLGVSTLTDPVPHYLTPINSVGIYTALPPAGVSFLGLEDPTVDHASLSYESCRWLWGNSGNPLGMTADGQIIFLNTVKEARAFQCDPAPTPPPDTCYKVEKSVVPTTAVTPGSMLTYTLTYTFNLGANCLTSSAKLVDVVPAGTTFVPGSADEGISPAADGSLTWLVTASDPGAHTRSFKVIVSDSACTSANPVVTNTAEMRVSGFPPKSSTPVTNDVTCPPIGLPNHEPVFAETELKASPYPLRLGQITQVSVRVENLNPTPQAVTVQFKTSPAQFGIGLNYSTLIGSAAATLPASGQAVLSTSFVSTFEGNTCIQAEIMAQGMANPLITQSCLDVTEVLSPGVAANLTVPVRNDTAHNPATIILVVDNTCPGWSAVVTNPASATLSLAAGASSNVTMTVTPPTTGPLGTGCHIDLQAWDNTDPAHPVLIGGVVSWMSRPCICRLTSSRRGKNRKSPLIRIHPWPACRGSCASSWPIHWRFQKPSRSTSRWPISGQGSASSRRLR